LFVAVGARRGGRLAHRALFSRPATACGGIGRHERHRLHQASREHFPASRWNGIENRPERLSAMSSAGPMLTDRQRLSWLRLIRTENVGPASFRGLINRFGSAEAALAVLPELALAGGAARPSRIPSEGEVEAEMAAALRFGARFVAIGEPDYPPLLRAMELPPPLVAIKGNAALFAPPAAAIVGARNASAAGTRMARLLAADLGHAGYVIVSGMARGIDTAAHEASLATGTIAVLAGGLDRPYPPENVALADRI